MLIVQHQLDSNPPLPVPRVRAITFPAAWLRRRHTLSPQRATLIAELIGFDQECT